MTIELFCDGGTIGRNPSAIGGVYAWCCVQQDTIIASSANSFPPSYLRTKKVGNNQAELVAAIKALEWILEETPQWNGVLWTDSKVTLYRLSNSIRFVGIPNWLRLQALALRRNRKWTPKLLGGHPTKKELHQGVLLRNGLPCSEWNVWCDKACQELANQEVKKQKGS